MTAHTLDYCTTWLLTVATCVKLQYHRQNNRRLCLKQNWTEVGITCVLSKTRKERGPVNEGNAVYTVHMQCKKFVCR